MADAEGGERRSRWVSDDYAAFWCCVHGKLGDPSALPALKWALRYDGDKILELEPSARSKYRIYEVKAKATEAIARIVDARN
jgi:hypothetical protein